MVNVKQAYVEAKKLTNAKYIKTILSFDKTFGFIFSDSKNEVDIGALCIMVGKDDPTQSVLVPVIFENLDFLNKGDKIPLSMIK